MGKEGRCDKMRGLLFLLAAVAVNGNALLPAELSNELPAELTTTELSDEKSRDVCNCNALTRDDFYSWQLATVDARMSVLDQALSNVSAYVMFYGYGRSGHSLIGALIDGHPNAILANEFD